MSRRPAAFRALAAAVLGLALVTVPSHAAAAVPPPEKMVDAVVVLRAQADLGAIRVTTRSGRLAAVERALRDTAAGAQRGVLRLLARRQPQQLVERVTPLWIVDEVGVRAAPSVLRELASRPDVVAVRPDLALSAPAPLAVTAAPAEDNIARVGAAKLWALGYRGQGTVVATMDTGVDLAHPDLAGRWRGGSSWYDPNGQHPSTPVDLNGHGTRTMSVIVGGDAGGSSIGMAPDARWIAVKIFNDRGMASSTAIHSGFQWLLDPDRNPATADAPNVVDNSWSMSSGGCLPDFQLDLRSLRAAGILPVFSAGNYGPGAGTVLSPANNPEAFAVGSTDDLDVVDPSSSRGPSACTSAVAPRLAAPGVGIRTADLYGTYIDSTGTSVAAPHVAGALSLLLSALPGLSADRQEAALTQGAVDLGPTGWDPAYGYGRLDVAAAYQWLASAPDFTLAASPASATVLPGGSAAYTVTVAGSNGFAGDVALSVAGLPAGASASVVPAVVPGGAGTAQVTVGTPTSVAPGTYPLTLTATSGALVRTAQVTLVVSPPPEFGLTVAPARADRRLRRHRRGHDRGRGAGRLRRRRRAVGHRAARRGRHRDGHPGRRQRRRHRPAAGDRPGRRAGRQLPGHGHRDRRRPEPHRRGHRGGAGARHRRVREPGVEDGHPAELDLVHGDGDADQRLHRFGLTCGQRAAVPVHGDAVDHPAAGSR